MKEDRVEEDRVSGLHFKMNTLDIRRDSLGSEVATVKPLPFNGFMRDELTTVAARDHYKAAVFASTGFECSPRGDNFICGAEGEVEQVLVKWMTPVEIFAPWYSRALARYIK